MCKSVSQGFVNTVITLTRIVKKESKEYSLYPTCFHSLNIVWHQATSSQRGEVAIARLKCFNLNAEYRCTLDGKQQALYSLFMHSWVGYFIGQCANLANWEKQMIRLSFHVLYFGRQKLLMCTEQLHHIHDMN